MPPQEGQRYWHTLARSLEKTPGLELRSAGPVAQALAERGAQCQQDTACLREIGAGLHLDKLVHLRVGRVSDTLVLRLTVYDISQGVRQGSWQEVLQAPTADDVARAMDRMVMGFAPRLDKGDPWYAKWWVWGAAGTLVAGAAATAVLLSQGDEEQLDLVVKPLPR